MLTNQQIKCIEYLVIGSRTNAEIATLCGCTDRVIYKWKNNEEFKAELKRRSLEFESGIMSDAHNTLVSTLGEAITNVMLIANDKKESSKIRLEANQYLINRILGNTTTKIESKIEAGNEENIEDLDRDEKELDNIINLKRS